MYALFCLRTSIHPQWFKFLTHLLKGNGQQQILLPENAQIVRLPGGGMQIIQPAGNQILQQQSSPAHQQVILVSRQNQTQVCSNFVLTFYFTKGIKFHH